jgi:hypothetical protein
MSIPSRIERKYFSDIQSIVFDQSYGNIIVKKSDSKQIQLEIQYYDGKNDKPVCEISTGRNTLSIKTIRPKNTGKEEIKIDYIIAIPPKIALSVNLKYGDIKMDDFNGDFQAQLEYSNLTSSALNNPKHSITCRYGNITIGSVSELLISTMYSNVRIDNVKKMEIDSKYTNYNIDHVQTIISNEMFSYGDLEIDYIREMDIKLAYSHLTIHTIEKQLTAQCSYSEIKIKETSKQLENIFINASYSDLTLGLHPDLSAHFDVNILYGNIETPKDRNVKYSVSEEKNNRIKKTGTIGIKSPTAAIKVSNMYADVIIK